MAAGRHLPAAAGAAPRVGRAHERRYRTLLAGDATFAYLRDDMLVAPNLSEQPQAVPLSGRVALSSYLDDREEDPGGELRLRPAEAVVVALSADPR